MKLLILTAIFAAVSSSSVFPTKEWPWKVGQEYYYFIETDTWTRFEGTSVSSTSFKAHLIIRVLAPGYLMAKINQTTYSHTSYKDHTYNVDPSDLSDISKHPFEIFVDGGRIISFYVPSSLSITYENLLKALLSALQVDLSPKRNVHDFPNSFDEETFQGLFKKMETDVTGECETLYTTTPLPANWIQKYSILKDSVQITKTKNYGSCKNRINLLFGVPEGAVFNGFAIKNEEKEFIQRTSKQSLVVGKQGNIYESEIIDVASVNPFYHGKQKAEVVSKVKAYLSSVRETSGVEWKKNESVRHIDSLLFLMKESMFYPKDADKNIAVVKEVLQQMSSMMQNPNQLPEADFLSKFIVLVRLICSLTREQLIQLTSNIEVARFSKNPAKKAMWIIYRDAVANAGTIETFEEIKTWVLSQKIQGEEAAEVISSLGASLRYPTLKVMSEFFDFALSPEVLSHKFVNNSAILAATKFFRFTKEEKFILETVIPRLSEELQQAVENRDSNKAQIYVRALGNLAHPEILKVYGPYLNGHIVVTKFLLTQMVASLKMLANLRDSSVRAVLFSILTNPVEAYEVRVAAALNIFMAFPTVEMMQVMAHMTNNDPSTQVRSALANGINFAAELKDPRFAELAKTAQAVKRYVTKEKFGYRTSTNSMVDEYTGEEDFAFFRELSYIGSEDKALPKYLRYAFRSIGTGWTEENQVTFSVSNLQQFLEYLKQSYTGYKPNKSIVDFKFSAKKIAEMLNIKPKTRGPLEGSLFLENFNQQKLITFTEDDLNALLTGAVKDMSKNMETLLKGIDMHYTKILNNRLTYVVFPLASGVPFFFEYNEPLIFSINGQIKFKHDVKNNDSIRNLYSDLDLIYARNMEGMVGFFDTFINLYSTAGVINKIQFYIPTKVHLMENDEIKLKLELPEKDATLMHFSVWPYIALQNKFDGVTVSENPNTIMMERSEKSLSTDLKFGQLSGVSYQLKGYSYSKDYANFNKLDDNAGLFTTLCYFLYQKDIALTQFNLKYLAAECKNKEVTFSLFYKASYNQKQDGENTPAARVTDVSTRREEISKRAAAGINSARVQLYDISVIFEGEKKVEYLLTAAYADSFVDNKVQGAFFYKGLDQFNAVFKLNKPQIVPLNFEEAMKNYLNVTYEVDLKYGDLENIHLTGYGERSYEYSKMLMKDSIAKLCLQETSNHNVYQMACYKMIIKAHAPDYFKASITYKEHGPEYMNLTNNGYEMLKGWFSHRKDFDFFKTIEDGKIEIKAQAFYYDNYIDYSFTSKYGTLKLNKVKGLEYFPFYMAVYGPTRQWERVESSFFYLPSCAVDNSKVWTFSGRSYDYSLTSSWHVVMVDGSNDNDLVILARRPADNQEEVYVSYGNGVGFYVELNISPLEVKVKSNALEVSNGVLTSYLDDTNKRPILEYYSLAEGVMVFNIDDQALRIVYDIQRLIIFTNNYRSTTTGICGQSTSQFIDNFMTPWGLVDQPELYGAAFSLDDEYSDAKTAELKKEAKLKAH